MPLGLIIFTNLRSTGAIFGRAEVTDKVYAGRFDLKPFHTLRSAE
jgi:hypothetical protein